MGSRSWIEFALLQLIIEAAARRLPIVVLDPKGSPALEATLGARGGVVWTSTARHRPICWVAGGGRSSICYLRLRTCSRGEGVPRCRPPARAVASWSLALDERPMDIRALRRRLDRANLFDNQHRRLDPTNPIDKRTALCTSGRSTSAHNHRGFERRDRRARAASTAIGVAQGRPNLSAHVQSTPTATTPSVLARSCVASSSARTVFVAMLSLQGLRTGAGANPSIKHLHGLCAFFRRADRVLL